MHSSSTIPLQLLSRPLHPKTPKPHHHENSTLNNVWKNVEWYFMADFIPLHNYVWLYIEYKTYVFPFYLLDIFIKWTIINRCSTNPTNLAVWTWTYRSKISTASSSMVAICPRWPLNRCSICRCKVNKTHLCSSIRARTSDPLMTLDLIKIMRIL